MPTPDFAGVIREIVDTEGRRVVVSKVVDKYGHGGGRE